MTAPKEFQGLDYCFALGEVYGQRTWRVDSYGRLRALHVERAKPWRPGVNVAVCEKKDDFFGGYASGGLVYPKSFFTAIYGDLTRAAQPSATTTPVAEEPPKAEPKPPHETPVETCNCGFYAYTDPRHEEAAGYRGAAYVTGIVRGSGRTLIGTKGFRCE
ncbi:MAG: hypothetical protein JWO67_5155, partial [Streptosporangiaceae bacterium]|nr:hypothetical protein [Streptosporangiaceae bacterium]